MQNILIALTLGIVAGAIDAAPMLRRPIPRSSILAIFAQWVLIGLLIPFIDWPVQAWFKGMLIGIGGMVPFMIQVYHRNRKAVFPTLIYGAVLGTAIGMAGRYWIR